MENKCTEPPSCAFAESLILKVYVSMNADSIPCIPMEEINEYAHDAVNEYAHDAVNEYAHDAVNEYAPSSLSFMEEARNAYSSPEMRRSSAATTEDGSSWAQSVLPQKPFPPRPHQQLSRNNNVDTGRRFSCTTAGANSPKNPFERKPVPPLPIHQRLQMTARNSCPVGLSPCNNDLSVGADSEQVNSGG